MKTKTEKTIIFKLGGIGDLLMATPAIRAFRQSFPRKEVIFIIGESNKAILNNNPYVDKVITLDDKALLAGSFLEKFKEATKLFSLLKRIQPQEIFILHRDWRYSLISFLAGVPSRYGFQRDLKGTFLTYSVSTPRNQHEIDNYLSLFALKTGFQNRDISMDLFPCKSEIDRIKDFFIRIPNRYTYVVLAPGGASNAKMEMDIKRWPIDYYTELATALLGANLNVILVGGKGDFKFTQQICQANPQFVNKQLFDVSGKLSIQETYQLISNCYVMVANDSGPMHIGASAGIPIISIFGPTNPLEYQPKINSKSFIFWSKQQCSPCYKDGFFPECPDKHCMIDVKPYMVYKKVIEILEEKR